jgi:hypothetical protein
MKIYNCTTCNKIYKTQSGLWKHNNKNHNKTISKNIETIEVSCTAIETYKYIQDNNIIQKTTNDKNMCDICNKLFNSRQSKWAHQTKCKISEINILKNEINKLKNNNNCKKIINNNNSNNCKIINNNINDNRKQIIINYNPGNEPINHLSSEQQKEILDKGLNSLLHLIKLTNFDKEKPEYHSYCVTAINDKHASMIDTNTQTVIKTDKVELFDTILSNNINKLEMISNNKIFSNTDRVEYKDKLDRLKKVLYEKKTGIKKYYSEINLLSFNNKEQIIETWNMVKKTLDDIINEENLSNTNIIL